MRRRLLALLAVALVSGTVAGTVASANERVGTSGAQRRAVSVEPVVTNKCPLPARYRRLFVNAARDAGLPLAMLVAVARVESNLRADARSSADARGLLQVLPATATALRLDVDHPASNVLAGARYLAQLLKQFHSTDLALAAYNAGPTAVAELGRAPSAETVEYVRNVTELWRKLHGCR